MLKKVTTTLAILMVLALASVGADTLVKNLQVTTMPTNIYFDGQLSAESNSGYYYNGKTNVPLALFYEGTTYVPLRYIGEKLGNEVGWDQSTRSVWVGTKPTSFATDTPPTTEHVATAPNIFGISVGKSEQEVTKLLGKPDRVDMSALGYEWWIYNQDLTRYIQVAIHNHQVVDVYSNSSKLQLASDLGVGSTKNQLDKKYGLKSTVFFDYDTANIELNNELSQRPLVFINNVPFIFYIDIHDRDKITAIRSMSIETLIKSGFYNYAYAYYTEPDLSVPILSAEEQTMVDQANERQILDLANAIRVRHNLPTFTWNEDAANVARDHSLDMLQNDFFAHTSATTGLNPFERMERYGIKYRTAGENIAYGYVDGIEAHEGWMNSLGHRKNVLEKDFTTLGVGVKELYYTQNFVTPR